MGGRVKVCETIHQARSWLPCVRIQSPANARIVFGVLMIKTAISFSHPREQTGETNT